MMVNSGEEEVVVRDPMDEEWDRQLEEALDRWLTSNGIDP